MKKLAVSYSKYLFDNIITLLFSALPLVDSVNGFLVRQGGMSIGSIYKVGLCAILLLPLLRTQKVRGTSLGALLVAIIYIVFSVGVNVFVLRTGSLQMDFVIKLIFNIVTLVLLMENYNNGTLTQMSFYRMLNNSAWLLPVCYFVPYILGIGYRVYGGDMGYKAFFIAQNELSLIIIVLFYFCLYKLTLRLQLSTFAQVGLLLLCGLLLNTKSTILACLLGAGVYFIYVLIKMPTKIRLCALIGVATAFAIFRDIVVEVCVAMIGRFTSLMGKYYGGSVLTSVLSGRDYLFQAAWSELVRGNFLFRFLFGNGFCSGILVEMDIVDIFFYLGIFGAVAAAAFLGWLFIKSHRNMKADPSPIRLLSFVLIVFFLNITGHVLFMAMSGCYFVVYMCFLMMFRTEDYQSANLNKTSV